MTEFRILSYDDGGTARAGVRVGERIYPAADLITDPAIDTASVLGLLADWKRACDLIAHAIDEVEPDGGLSLSEIRLLAPVLYPPGLFFAGANYWDHVEEMTEFIKKMTGKEPPRERPEHPFLLIGTPVHSVVGSGAEIEIPAFTEKMDWEAELGVVIGKPGRDVSTDDAFDHVAGYTVINDLSARDWIERKDAVLKYDWLSHKGFEGAKPMGPWITPARFVPEPQNLEIKLWLNDDLKQDSNTDQMIHGIADQVSFLSTRVALRPGDVIATGTPAGVGMPAGTFIQPGDTVRLEIEKCGTLINTFS